VREPRFHPQRERPGKPLAKGHRPPAWDLRVDAVEPAPPRGRTFARVERYPHRAIAGPALSRDATARDAPLRCPMARSSPRSPNCAMLRKGRSRQRRAARTGTCSHRAAATSSGWAPAGDRAPAHTAARHDRLHECARRACGRARAPSRGPLGDAIVVVMAFVRWSGVPLTDVRVEGEAVWVSAFHRDDRFGRSERTCGDGAPDDRRSFIRAM
jgi:hypothetical protein